MMLMFLFSHFPLCTFCHLALAILDVFHGVDREQPVVVVYSFSTISLIRVG